jgi:hypothetical protein
MKKLIKARNLFPCTDYTFCKNEKCKSYNKCVRAMKNYEFDKQEFISVSINLETIESCSLFIPIQF